VRIAFATCSALPDGWPDDHPAAALLGAEMVPWDDPTARWEDYDRVIVRSVFDYAQRCDQFLGWCDRVGAARLRNTPELIRFNADKRYLATFVHRRCQACLSALTMSCRISRGRSW
jgi:hypothetical protein